MGWTHDYRDVSHNRRRTSNQAAAMDSIRETPEAPDIPELQDRKDQAVIGNRLGPPLGIPRILGRRARWMTARLRHVRND